MVDNALFPILLPHVRQTKGIRFSGAVIRKRNNIWQSLDETTQSESITEVNSTTVTIKDLKIAINPHLKATNIQ